MWLAEIRNADPFGYLAQPGSERILYRTNWTSFWNFVLWMTDTMNGAEMELYNKYVEWKTCTNHDSTSEKIDFSIWEANVL
jgi:hypothetical protein